jgi:hypothetical protein
MYYSNNRDEMVIWLVFKDLTKKDNIQNLVFLHFGSTRLKVNQIRNNGLVKDQFNLLQYIIKFSVQIYL